MKILIVKSYSKLGSVGYLARELKRRGHDIHVLVPSEHPDCEKMRNFGITIHISSFPTMQPSKLRKLKSTIKSIIEIADTIRANLFDVVHLNLSHARLLGRLASLLSKRKVVVSTIHGFEASYERSTNWIDDATVAVSAAVKGYLVSKGMPENKIEIIRNGIDIEHIDRIPEDKFYLHKELGLDSRIMIIGMVAYFYDLTTKGHKVFLDAARILVRQFSEVRFVIVGSNILCNGCKEYFQDYAKKVGLKDKVYFLGEREDVPSIMSSLYLHVLPSLSDGSPFAVIEAMVRRVPNIASNIAAIGEIIHDGKTGILFETGNYRSLAQSIICLLNSPGERNRIALAARESLENEFRVKDMAEKYESLFERILARKV